MDKIFANRDAGKIIPGGRDQMLKKVVNGKAHLEIGVFNWWGKKKLT